MIYAFLTSGAKTVLGLLLAVYLTSKVFGQGLMRNVMFFPTLVSTIGVGITFSALMHPTKGVFNVALAALGIDGPGWLVDPHLALFSIAIVDVGGASVCAWGSVSRRSANDQAVHHRQLSG